MSHTHGNPHHDARTRYSKRRIDGAIPQMQNVLLDAEYCEHERDTGLDYNAGRATPASIARLLASCEPEGN